MKVTVSFGETRVIVPCGDGEVKVLELIKRAVSRYQKASQKENKLVRVHCLQTKEENAILDIDDLVMDVCDDKDMLIAIYNEVPSKNTVACHDSDVVNNNITNQKLAYTPNGYDDTTVTNGLSDNDSGVAGDSYGIPSNPPSSHTSLNSSSKPPRGIQRKMPQNKNVSTRSSFSSNSPTSSPEIVKRDLQSGFNRDMTRKSLSSNHPMLYSWIDQHDTYNNTDYPDVYPGQVATGDNPDSEEIQLDQRSLSSVVIRPYVFPDGEEAGLVVQYVVKGSYVDRIGELKIGDQIIAINDISLLNYCNSESKDLYDKNVLSEVVKFKRKRSHSFFKKYIEVENPSQVNVPEVAKISKEAPRVLPDLPQNGSKEAAIEAPSEVVQEPRESDAKHYFNVDLQKGKDGLGFSITSKDVATTDSRTFFVKNVLNRGAAITDGRIKPGDEVIKVNNVSVSDKRQAEVVKLLRTAQGIVSLQLARKKNDITEEEQDKPVEAVITTVNQSEIEEHNQILTLTIPLTKLGSASLGISVKGKQGVQNDEDQGIFVKSVLKGGAAAKDGRILSDDQLLCINDTSLIGLSNGDAMRVLRLAMERSMEIGSIRIIIGRAQSNNGTHKAIEQENGLNLSDESNEFSERTYSPKHYQINRNKSYFRAISPPSLHSSLDNDDSSSSPRTVSVSSAELPAVQKPKPFYFTPEKDSASPDRMLPTYEEALKRRDTNSSGSSHSSRTDSQPFHSMKMERNGMMLLPDRKFDVKEYSKNSQSGHSTVLKRFLSDKDLANVDSVEQRTASLASQTSLDSVLVGPNQIPFSRDAFGRTSMSERKGRAHIDATKSDFYNKLKKYRSMEELKVSQLDDLDALNSENSLGLTKRTESVDTLISRVDEEERHTSASFLRNTNYSSSAPHHHLTRVTSDPRVEHAQNPNISAKLRPNRKGVKSRPYSCIFEDARKRNDLLNSDASNTSRSQDQKNEKKKKGFLKGFSTLLKKNKNRKDGRAQSPEYFEPNRQSNENLDAHMYNVNMRNRPLTVTEATLTQMSGNREHPLALFQPDRLQKELVQAKITEMEKRKQHRKSDVGPKRNLSPDKSSSHGWNVHDAANMREKSKQFFFVDAHGDFTRSSTRSAQLQRQSSLPPRNKKDSVDSNMVTREFSGQSQDISEPGLRNKSSYSSTQHGSSSAPNSKPGTPVKKITVSTYDSLPRRSKNRDRKLRQKNPDSNHAGSNTVYSSLSDLTKHSGSVSISHKAQI